MIKKHKEQYTDTRDVTDDIICNRCGKSVHRTKDMCGNTMFIDYVSFKHVPIVGERMNTYIEDFHLCEDCLNELNKQFKIPIQLFKI